MAILVPIAANSGLGDEVLDVAVTLANGLDEELYVVHIVTDEARMEDKRIRDALRETVVDAEVPATVSLEQVGHWAPRPRARIGQDILELAEDVDVSHIVMGHTAKGVLEELTQGSAVEAVVDNAPVPVTVVSERVLED
ncbi:universal stress protein [Halorhabdus salina]|uniref:universal stress protein n=1 Tax=Halorhabdus salina TaxID=2750670 RepID=UPI0015EF0B5B|nr:universal stress protein [Halorhabdus salina]